MGLLETLQHQPAAWPGPKCSIGNLLHRLPSDRAAELAAVIDAKHAGDIAATWQTIIDSIRAEYGINDLPTAFTFSRHARHLCTCKQQGHTR